jgi:hypothetical protein
MSLIEGDAYFPLFTTDLPIDFSAVPDSPGKLQQYVRRPSFALSNSQAVPANYSIQNLGLDEPMFSLFMNGHDKMDLNGGFMKGFQIPEELLLQSSMVPDLRKLDMMGMDHRQFAQMGIMPSDPMINGDFNMVPQLSPNEIKQGSDDTTKGGSKKRKFIANAVKDQVPGLPVPDGQPLTPEEERNMKRQRRLVKNREAAQLFRQRQKAYIQDLEKKVADLSATNNDFRARVELLNSENKLIKEQLLYLRNFITQAVSFSFPKSPGSEDATGSTSPNSLLGPMPAGLTLPPEILGAMSNMPNMALGLMGAMGPGCNIPGLSLPHNFAESFSLTNLPTAPPTQSSGASSPAQPHMEPNAIKLSPGASRPTSPVASGSAVLIPPPTKPLNTSHNGTNAVVPQFTPSSPQQMMVPDGADIKVKFDAQGNIVKQAN